MEWKICALISYHTVTRCSWKDFSWETVIDLINIWFSAQFQRRPCQSFKIKNLEREKSQLSQETGFNKQQGMETLTT